jgi:hypothetical protein
LNLQDLLSRFEHIDEFFWSVFPEQAEDIDEGQAYVTLSGRVAGNSIRFHLFAIAPPDVDRESAPIRTGRSKPCDRRASGNQVVIIGVASNPESDHVTLIVLYRECAELDANTGRPECTRFLEVQ